MADQHYDRFFVRAGACTFPAGVPAIPDGIRPVLWLDNSIVPEASMTAGAFWVTEPFEMDEVVAHPTGGMMWFCGPDRDDPEDLDAELEITLGGDVIPITHTGALYVPAGVPVGNFKATRVGTPVLCYSSSFDTGAYNGEPATMPVGTGAYAGHYVERYEPTSGIMPEAPEGFLQLLCWLAGDKVPGAPYLELCRFMDTNPDGPAAHVHEKEEFIGFIGLDPEHPDDLGADVIFYLGEEEIHTTKSTVIFVPGNVPHSPIIVPELHRDIIHFSGSGFTEYDKTEV